MAIFEEFEKKLQADPKSIVFTEGTDARILSAASKLLAAKTLKVILLGEAEAVKKAAGFFDVRIALVYKRLCPVQRFHLHQPLCASVIHSRDTVCGLPICSKAFQFRQWRARLLPRSAPSSD